MYRHTIARIGRNDTAYTLRVAIDSRLSKSDQMRLTAPAIVELFNGKEVVLPAGFVTDCHSTPRLLASLLPEYDNRTNIGAVVHDYLYMHWEEFAQDQYPHDYQIIGDGPAARWYADGIYLSLMDQFHPKGWRNRLYYAAVRVFGWYNWEKFRELNQNEKGNEERQNQDRNG